MGTAGSGVMLAGGHGRERGVRASDADRDRSAAALSEHYAAGRLTLEEYHERLDRAYAAKTLGDLDDLMTDLPGTDPGQLPSQGVGHPPLAGRRTQGTVQVPDGRHPAVSPFWLGVAVGAFVAWLISGATAGPWFLLVVVVLALIMLRRWSKRAERRIDQHHQQPR
jgi:uncharacterized membrane protein